jgi:phosphoribosyl-ATP pyrophosphohydrolase
MTLNDLYATILDRKQNPKPGSYTNSLFDDGLPRMAQKVGEEGTEVVVAAGGRNRRPDLSRPGVDGRQRPQPAGCDG